MKSRVVDRMKHNLPSRNTETRAIGQHSQKLQSKIRLRGSIDPSSIPIPQLRPRLNEELERVFGSRTARQLFVINFRQSAKPNSLPIVNMPERLQDTRMRRTQTLVQLLRRQCRTRIKNPGCPPGRVAGMREQQLLKLRHKRDCNRTIPGPGQLPGKIELYGSHRLLRLLVP